MSHFKVVSISESHNAVLGTKENKVKKLTVAEHASKVQYKIANRTNPVALNNKALWMAIAKVIKSDTMELRAQYVTELIEAIADAEFHNALDYAEEVSA